MIPKRPLHLSRNKSVFLDQPQWTAVSNPSAVNKWIFIGEQVGAGCLNTCLIMEEMCSISGVECGVI